MKIMAVSPVTLLVWLLVSPCTLAQGVGNTSFLFSAKSPNPNTTPIRIGSSLFGTTSAISSQKCKCSTIYKISADGSQTILHKFYKNTVIFGGLSNIGNTIYGTTDGGKANRGLVFSLSVAGEFKELYSFAGGEDGSSPVSALLPVTDQNGDVTLYGATLSGGGKSCGGYGCGTIYSITPQGSYKQVYVFKPKGGDGQNPESDLTLV